MEKPGPLLIVPQMPCSKTEPETFSVFTIAAAIQYKCMEVKCKLTKITQVNDCPLTSEVQTAHLPLKTYPQPSHNIITIAIVF